MPPPSGRAVSHVRSYFTKEPTDNPDFFLCTCQICESQGVNPLVSYDFTRGGGTGSFNKHLAKKHGITKETHAASGSGTTSGSRQWDIPSGGRRFLDEKRSRLAPHSIQICVCKKDWDQAELQTQGLKNDNDQGDDDPWMMMDTSASLSGGESAEASNQPDDDDEVE
ncbi:uncharacterized protein LOC130801158 [Amaranthus tricolor]|uniref:uncharacterized protein LOC130801158 n=1 Tax=Amaranthus tricolor TaxID=29722 RepID=UPI00258F7589|nr:uncharacterized protein LOC130801158 [Amaranthus tricolor]XP_057520915.1 uncharacterized protein LOC130801158 [Amaranthus tricolor]XP_057520917.1 uncharacterized protein LOC130801158 [Amaranthus tricolor]XP_057520918.1 uncharacterized protein LOC130801158 [Amaranthus tricolor]XP_057520919.1 uncharacterized protein LOC130801158 [Amaranthus tricolor]XP_057520920.1 uncharacterized protein LOC130801158 [Amaranthus tricolor]XP_057520921.1 uncharacterized protein LOC130801158 [Amaranthus tricolo